MLLADRLDCSIDYLLGRTNDPVLHRWIRRHRLYNARPRVMKTIVFIHNH